MKKVALLTPLIALVNTAKAFAQNDTVNLNIGTPDQGIKVDAQPNVVLTNIISIIFGVAALAVLFMLILGAFQWITSGGDKDAVGKARGRIVNALIGLVVLALAFLIAKVVGGIVNIDVTNLVIPTLDKGA